MSDIWLEYQMRCFKRMVALREVRKPKPSNPFVSKIIREMPNLFKQYASPLKS